MHVLVHFGILTKPTRSDHFCRPLVWRGHMLRVSPSGSAHECWQRQLLCLFVIFSTRQICCRCIVVHWRTRDVQKYNNNAICLTMKQLQFQCSPLFADTILDMMIVMHRILTSVISVLTTYLCELNMVLDYWSLISNWRQCFGLGTQTHSYDPQYALAAYAGCS